MKTTNLREVPISEIVDLPAHPVADFFPMLANTDKDREAGRPEAQTISLAELADSIIENGLQEPIVLFHGERGKELLDGRNRRAACVKAGIERVLVEDFEGSEEEAEEYILNLNIDRRDLTPGQRAKAASQYWDYEAEKAKLRQSTLNNEETASLMSNLTGATGTTRDHLARRFRVSNSYIQKLHKEQEKVKALQAETQRLQEAADEQARKAEEAKLRLEEAKAAADKEAVREAASEINRSVNKKEELREQAAERAAQAADVQSNLDKIDRGKSVNNVYGEKKKAPTEDDPMGHSRIRYNQHISGAIKELKEQAIMSNQGSDAYNFLGAGAQRLCETLQEEFNLLLDFECYEEIEEG